VDKYQGRDKPVILLSFVKSKECNADDKVSIKTNTVRSKGRKSIGSLSRWGRESRVQFVNHFTT